MRRSYLRRPEKLVTSKNKPFDEFDMNENQNLCIRGPYKGFYLGIKILRSADLHLGQHIEKLMF